MNTNSSIQASRQLSVSTRAITRALERLSSGKRVNSPTDDAAAYSLGVQLDSQVRGLTRASQNINEALGVIDASSSAIESQLEIVQRMREIAVQTSNGTLTTNDRESLSIELQQLFQEFERISESSKLGDLQLLDGTQNSLDIQLGANARESFTLNLESTQSSEVFMKARGIGLFTTSSVPLTTGNNDFYIAPVVADLNQDGHLDIVQTSQDSLLLSIVYGNGDGSFKAGQTFSLPSGSFDESRPLIFDVDDDGDQDIIQNSGSVSSVFLNSGNGAFSLGSTAVGGGYYTPIAGDFNSDGITDFLTGGSAAGFVIEINNGEGVFTPLATVATTYGGDYAVSDFNNDGKLDVLQRNSLNVAVRLGNGDGTFSTGATITPGGAIVLATAPVIADVNNDGNQDFLIADNNAGNILVRLGDGNGAFATAATLTGVGIYPMAPTLKDLNNDGNLDVVSIGDRSGNISVRFGNGNGTFAVTTTLSLDTTLGTFWTWSSPVVEDFTGDGNLDILATGYNTNSTAQLFVGSGGSTFKLLTASAEGSSPGTPGDFNEDGVLDFVRNASFDDEFIIYQQSTVDVSALSEIDVTSQESSQFLLGILDNAISTLTEKSANLAAARSALEQHQSHNLLLAENFHEARSVSIDADIAVETSELTRNQILQKAQIAVLGQSNMSIQMILGLLEA